MNLEERIQQVVDLIPSKHRDLLKVPATQDQFDRLEQQVSTELDRSTTIHQSVRQLYLIFGGEKIVDLGETSKYSRHQRLLGSYRMYTPDQARVQYDYLAREANSIGERGSQWFLKTCVPLGEGLGDYDTLCCSIDSGAVLVQNSLGMCKRSDSLNEYFARVVLEIQCKQLRGY